MDYQNLAKVILENVGGNGNVTGLTHCATRLRFNLQDERKAKTEELKKTKGVMGVVSNGGQYQIIIGSDVPNVYKELMKICGTTDGKAGQQKDNRSLGARFIDTISGIFTPILPVLVAAGMLKAVLSLLTALSLVDKSAQAYQIISFMADAGYYFLPLMLANSAAKKFNCNIYLAMMLGGILLHPNFVSMVAASKESGEAIKLFFLPIYNANYSSSVIPIILSVWFMSKVEPIADRISPKPVKYFTRPLITVLVTGVVSLVVLGPVGYVVANFIATTLTTLDVYAGWLVPTIVGAVLPLLVMTGTHYSLVSVSINSRMTIGYDTMINTGSLASNIAQGGAVLAVSFKSKVKEIKELASSAGVTAVCGITEPALYGVTMRHRTCLYSTMIGGACGGFFMGIFHVRNYTGGSPGLMTMPGYLGGDGFHDLIFAALGALIAFVIAFAVSFVIYRDPREEAETSVPEEKKEPVNKTENKGAGSICAPLSGRVVPLSEVNDPTFAQEILGKGAAIIPAENTVVSPVNGTVEMVFDTLHAIGLRSEDGAEVLIHIGLDTVKLGGKYFKAFVKNGDTVKTGDPLVEFDMEKIKAEGYDVITPVIISNTMEYGDIIAVSDQEIKAGEGLIKVIR